MSLDPELLAQLEQLDERERQLLLAQLEGSGAVAQDHAVAAGREGRAAGRDLTEGHRIDAQQVVLVEGGAKVVLGQQPVEMSAVDRETALGSYLSHLISRNRYLQLQGIRSGGRLVHIELDRIYITLRATRKRTVGLEEEWLRREGTFAPGELLRHPHETLEEVAVAVEEALTEHSRLVVLGDPGSGKTTLLRYLALLYARDLAEGSGRVPEELGLDEPSRLPILLSLRQTSTYLRAKEKDDGTDGHKQLLDFLFRSLVNERINLPSDFFDPYLTEGEAVVLFDGLDEVADPSLRRRVSRLVESFTRAYPRCRYLVSSRIVGYTGAARLGEEYVTTTIRPFRSHEIEEFLRRWHRLEAVSRMGPTPSAEVYASRQTAQLVEAIESNERIRELAINPLLLTVIALVHRDRVRLPDRRAELYGEAVDVLLGKWEEAKGVEELSVLGDRPFDAGDKRLLLQALALSMHEREVKEIDGEDLLDFFTAKLGASSEGAGAGRKAAERFLRIVEERTGLLVSRGEGVWAFSHLTFQEYLAALAVTARDDYVHYTLERTGDAWWREVVLLEAGDLSMRSKERCTRLIEAMARSKREPEPHHNLVVAAECLRDVGASRVERGLEEELRERLRNELERRPSRVECWLQRFTGDPRSKTRGRIRVARALSLVGGQRFWSPPYGEPEWVEIAAGEFWMGEGDETHRLHLERFLISRVPVTNAQYELFVQATGHEAPTSWEDGRLQAEAAAVPVTDVSWYDAVA